MITSKQIKYIPILRMRPAEMKALRHLPGKDKCLMQPLILVKPWANSNNFANTVKTLESAYSPGQNWFADLDKFRKKELDEKIRDGEQIENPVAIHFLSLFNPENGYENWCEFVRNHDKITPCIQLFDLTQFSLQVDKLAELKRGLVLRAQPETMSILSDKTYLAKLLSKSNDNKIGIVIDLHNIENNLNLEFKAAQIYEIINKIHAVIHPSFISISGTSFPELFVNLPNQEIKERILFNLVKKSFGEGTNLIYSDWGSTRIKSQTGGNGDVWARIDLPSKQNWKFFRSPIPSRDYCEWAKKAISDESWNPNLRIWGAQQILDTSRRQPESIICPNHSTSARINIHLHRQIYYDDEIGFINTDDEDASSLDS